MTNGKAKPEKSEATGRSAFSVPDLVTAAAICIEEPVERGARIKLPVKSLQLKKLITGNTEKLNRSKHLISKFNFCS
jgi:hypothetical protein